ncbi:hypothetical protein OSB04_026958 [Centaurea solstitialis]|uniref:MLO-like protein n=1 Tax=Centaurea solstitialis TaxID=347529 RepID=A0AA38VZ81_9ASTR|nr:hypothetical protein OSB04_026958 [Centaurea solstitialis]
MGGSSEGRSLEQTPTWAVATVCSVLVLISIVIEHIIHMIGQWLKKEQKKALYEALEKIKAELMLLGFISLLLTVGTTPITKICISESVASTWHPCNKQSEEYSTTGEIENRRRLLSAGDRSRRILAGASSYNKCAEKGKVSFMSYDGVHQLHIFIFVLAVSHVLYCILTMALGRAKAHLAPESHSRFDFQKYINRSLDEDLKVVVSIRYPPIWLFAVAFLVFNTHASLFLPNIALFLIIFHLILLYTGWYSYLWLPFIPLIILLVVGTKLQVIITKMGLKIQERGEVVKGVPVVHPGDYLFWFNRPRLLLYLLNFVLFQVTKLTYKLAYFYQTILN